MKVGYGRVLTASLLIFQSGSSQGEESLERQMATFQLKPYIASQSSVEVSCEVSFWMQSVLSGAAAKRLQVLKISDTSPLSDMGYSATAQFERATREGQGFELIKSGDTWALPQKSQEFPVVLKSHITMNSTSPNLQCTANHPSRLQADDMTRKLQKFGMFCRFPIELRLKIWAFSLESRVLELLYDFTLVTVPSKEHSYLETTFTNEKVRVNTSPPALLHVSREAREVALKIYQQPFARPCMD
jgi:hypothetical protein